MLDIFRCFSLYCALPDDKHFPAPFPEALVVFLIPLCVLPQLLTPEFGIATGPFKELTMMYVPKTAVDENYGSVFGQD